MTEFLHIEPSRDRRSAFALWCLAQDPVIQTSSASGFDVPVSLYPTVPTELLEGGYVDGYLYGGAAAPQPVPQAAEGVKLSPRGGLLDVAPARAAAAVEAATGSATVDVTSGSKTLMIEDDAPDAIVMRPSPRKARTRKAASE